MAAPVVGDDAIAVLEEEQHLRVSIIGRQRLAVAEDHGLAAASVFVVQIDVAGIFLTDRNVWPGESPFCFGCFLALIAPSSPLGAMRCLLLACNLSSFVIRYSTLCRVGAKKTSRDRRFFCYRCRLHVGIPPSWQAGITQRRGIFSYHESGLATGPADGVFQSWMMPRRTAIATA